MSETKNDKKQDNRFTKFSLIELLTILILVGLIFIFVVPINQARVSRERIDSAIKTIAFIGEKAEEFKNNPDNGYYPDLSQLNLNEQVDTLLFTYSINSEDSTVVAETKQSFGKKGAYLVYNIGGKQYRVGKDDSDLTSKKYINENWLP